MSSASSSDTFSDAFESLSITGTWVMIALLVVELLVGIGAFAFAVWAHWDVRSWEKQTLAKQGIIM